MSLTRDQLRAARVLLHLQQTQLADIARIGVATIRRFEGGKDIGHLYLDALRRAVVEAGAILIDEAAANGTPPGAVGVALRSEGELPAATRARIAADQVPTTAVPSGAEAIEKVRAKSFGKAQDEQPSSRTSERGRVSATPSGTKAERGRRGEATSPKVAPAKRARKNDEQPSVAPPRRGEVGDEPSVTETQLATEGGSAVIRTKVKRLRRRDEQSSVELPAHDKATEKLLVTQSREDATNGSNPTPARARSRRRRDDGASET